MLQESQLVTDMVLQVLGCIFHHFSYLSRSCWFHHSIRKFVCVRGLVWRIDQTVLLCVDQVVVHMCEKDKAERERVVEADKANSQTTMTARETWCARMTNNCFKGDTTLRHKAFLNHTRGNAAACTASARYGAVFPVCGHLGKGLMCSCGLRVDANNHRGMKWKLSTWTAGAKCSELCFYCSCVQFPKRFRKVFLELPCTCRVPRRYKRDTRWMTKHLATLGEW